MTRERLQEAPDNWLVHMRESGRRAWETRRQLGDVDGADVEDGHGGDR